MDQGVEKIPISHPIQEDRGGKEERVNGFCVGGFSGEQVGDDAQKTICKLPLADLSLKLESGVVLVTKERSSSLADLQDVMFKTTPAVLMAFVVPRSDHYDLTHIGQVGRMD